MLAERGREEQLIVFALVRPLEMGVLQTGQDKWAVKLN
jgi:hypothetical protein